MARKVKDKFHHCTVTSVALSDDVVELVDGVSTHRWAVDRFEDESDTYPVFTARAEIVGTKKAPRLAITEMVLGDGTSKVTSTHLSALAKIVHELPADILARRTILWDNDDLLAKDKYVDALRAALRRPAESQWDREDEILHRWEEELQPAGMNQRDAAVIMNVSYSTFRTYLTYARARRDRM